MTALLFGYFVVFMARVIDVTMMTLRVLMVMRGKKLWAATFGFFEVLIYIIALKLVFDTLDDPVSLIVYSLGFAAGNVVGSWLEEKLAIGYLTMQVITFRDAWNFSDRLREQGFGVSLFPCQGREGCHQLLNIVFERKRFRELEKKVNEWDPKAFVTVTDTRPIRGGTFRATRK
ncbi:DUF2179 domain-containing protein [Heliorestis acidaminivorans]|uniref:UPF0316 protein F9B85_05480 n=1 Tax=Heliorestis acidaminivorans TaxID=553427 RepID=A0A6I0F461_9FIRM|nr:DUF2179 domain-containing protein [Heliorestis acidaminivorans]KAB2953362.1 DUF2179 domain-containing protein [Heliorestis acidaminivorans]